MYKDTKIFFIFLKILFSCERGRRYG